jgi:hypothetical protein
VLCGVLTGVAAVGLLLSAGVTIGGLVAGVSVALICLMAYIRVLIEILN